MLENCKKIIFTDGGATVNDTKTTENYSGCSTVVIDLENETLTEINEAWISGSNNVMEMKGVLNGLLTLLNEEVVFFVDSQYVIKGITEWGYAWQQKGFRAVKNANLWKHLLDINKRKNTHYVHVKGHSNNYFNEMCDKHVFKMREYSKTMEEPFKRFVSERKLTPFEVEEAKRMLVKGAIEKTKRKWGF